MSDEIDPHPGADCLGDPAAAFQRELHGPPRPATRSATVGRHFARRRIHAGDARYRCVSLWPRVAKITAKTTATTTTTTTTTATTINRDGPLRKTCPRPKTQLICGLLLLAACGTQTARDGALPALGAPAIETDASGRCFGRDITPAVIETVTEQVLERPAVTAPDGTVIEPAVYRRAIRQQIVRDRREVQFETPCPPVFTPAFVASLQRALTARGFYRGPITGTLDTATGRAVQEFQRRDGPDSPLLSIASARSLGLVALDRDTLAAEG